MPIVVKDFSWWQTGSKVFVQVQIPHVSQKNSDVLTSNKYLKVSFILLKKLYFLRIVYLSVDFYLSICIILYTLKP